jgi:hypothetical protein
MKTFNYEILPFIDREKWPEYSSLDLVSAPAWARTNSTKY